MSVKTPSLPAVAEHARHRCRQCAAGRPSPARIRAARRHRRGWLRHRVPRVRPFAGARRRDQGVPAGRAGGAQRQAAGVAAVGVALRDLRARHELVRQRSQAARALRPSVAAEGAPLLGRQRHRLHGDAAVPWRHAAAAAPEHAALPGRRVVAAPDRSAARRARRDAPRGCVPSRHRTRQRDRGRRRTAGAARLRRRAPRDQRPQPDAHRDPEAELCAAGAVRRIARHAARTVDRLLRAGRDAALPHHRQAAGAGHRARAERRPAATGRFDALATCPTCCCRWWTGCWHRVRTTARNTWPNCGPRSPVTWRCRNASGRRARSPGRPRWCNRVPRRRRTIARRRAESNGRRCAVAASVRGVPLWGTAVAMAVTAALGAWWASSWDDAPARARPSRWPHPMPRPRPSSRLRRCRPRPRSTSTAVDSSTSRPAVRCRTSARR